VACEAVVFTRQGVTKPGCNLRLSKLASTRAHNSFAINVVPGAGLEPARACAHEILSLACTANFTTRARSQTLLALRLSRGSVRAIL
jgi:hypothetical protein